MYKYSFSNHFVLDNFETWPTSITDLLEKNKSIINGYIHEEKRNEARGQRDVIFSNNLQNNSFQEAWDDIILQIKQILRNIRIIGFHCTRLTDFEVGDIISNGLVPLNEEFSRKRIEILIQKKKISQESSKKIIHNNKMNLDSRRDKVYLSHCVSSLTKEYGFYRFFRYWGGEAIYSSHEKDELVASELKKIGLPCIVVASIVFSEFKNTNLLIDNLIGIWIDSARRNPNPSSFDIDTKIGNPISVVEVLDYNNQVFQIITNCSLWKKEIL